MNQIIEKYKSQVTMENDAVAFDINRLVYDNQTALQALTN